MEEVYHHLVNNLRAFFRAQNFRRAVIGLSGGVDSSLTLKIAVDALGADNITALILPELGLTSEENIMHAKKLAEYFEIKSFHQPINPFIVDFNTLPWKPSPIAQINTKARIRAVILYNYANTENALVLGTSNKSEIMLGYGTKYGDLAADVEVIGSLFKTEVYQLAEHVGLPDQIINKAPTAELAPGQTDEQELGATYEDLDQVLKQVAIGKEKLLAQGFRTSIIEKVLKRIETNRHKTKPPIVIQKDQVQSFATEETAVPASNS